MEILTILLDDIFLSLFANFALLIVPEEKLKRWQVILLKILGIIVSVTFFVLFVTGISLMSVKSSVIYDVKDNYFNVGLIMLLVAIGLFIFQITLHIITKKLMKKKQKNQSKHKNETSNTEEICDDN